MRINAYAKINWDLHILAKRPDGYHELDSVMVNVGLFDTLTIEPSEKFQLTCSDPALPIEENLVSKAARQLAEEAGIAPNCRIHLQKSIPAGGGMGGGSSDAAAALKALNEFWKLNFSREKLAAITAKLGSDISFFLYGGWCRCEGRGEIVTTLPGVAQSPAVPLLLVLPELHVSTPSVYKALRVPSEQKYRGGTLTEKGAVIQSQVNAAFGSKLHLGLVNDLTDAACTIEPRLRPLQKVLEREFPGRWLMSGSGAVHFVVPFGPNDGIRLKEQLFEETGTGIRVITTTTLSPSI